MSIKKRKGRLFTFGCSFTYYFWPTWADFLGMEFEHYENWAQWGIGNRAIAERVAECHAKNKFTKDDVVIVQWSVYARHDYYKPIHPIEFWRTKGGLFTDDNLKVYDMDWLSTFFNEEAYVMHMLNNIVMVQNLLKTTNCQWYMTSIKNIELLGTDIKGGVDDEFEKGKESIEKDFPRLKFYIDKIWKENKTHWLYPIQTHSEENTELGIWFLYDGVPWLDKHPSPSQHADWLNKILRPMLNLGDPPIEQKLWINSVSKALKKEKNNFAEFCRIVHGNADKTDWYPKDTWPQIPIKGTLLVIK